MRSIRKILTGAVILAASLGAGSAFAPEPAGAAKACWQHQKVYNHNITWGYTTESCDGGCGTTGSTAVGECCAACGS